MYVVGSRDLKRSRCIDHAQLKRKDHYLVFTCKIWAIADATKMKKFKRKGLYFLQDATELILQSDLEIESDDDSDDSIDQSSHSYQQFFDPPP